MKLLPYVGAAAGLALLVALGVHADLASMARMMEAGGVTLLWILPYRALFFLLYAVGWQVLLEPVDPGHRASLFYVTWVTTVRDAVDRLLPVASVGGSLVGVRLLGFRGLSKSAVGASVIVEILLTLIALYLFTGLGLSLLAQTLPRHEYRQLLWPFALSLPVPILTVLLVRHGAIFGRLGGWVGRMIGHTATGESSVTLDRELQEALARGRRLLVAGGLQCLALLSGSFEVWLALRVLGHPVDVREALTLESLSQAARQLAFMIPAGIGAQEAGLVLVGHAFGLTSELALALSLVKRAREVIWGLPALVSWQWIEALHVRQRTVVRS